jgi:hypothetical protein
VGIVAPGSIDVETTSRIRVCAPESEGVVTLSEGPEVAVAPRESTVMVSPLDAAARFDKAPGSPLARTMRLASLASRAACTSRVFGPG